MEHNLFWFFMDTPFFWTVYFDLKHARSHNVVYTWMTIKQCVKSGLGFYHIIDVSVKSIYNMFHHFSLDFLRMFRRFCKGWQHLPGTKVSWWGMHLEQGSLGDGWCPPWFLVIFTAPRCEPWCWNINTYPLVNVYITIENHHVFNGTIHYKLPFSIAMFVYQRVHKNHKNDPVM